MTVRRSGRVWSNRRFKPWGSSEAATVTGRAWLPARRSGSLEPREASQPAAAKIKRTFSSAPQVRARATCSGAGAVLRAIDCATATSALVGPTVTGTLGPRPGKFADNLATLNMTLTITKESTFPTREPWSKVLPCRRKSATSKRSGAPVSNSATDRPRENPSNRIRNKWQRLPFELKFPLASEAFQCITTSRN
jgi:hypothetical protein